MTTGPGTGWLTQPTVVQAWVLLLVAGALEIGWAVGLKSTAGFTRPLPTAVVIAVAMMSFWLLAVAVRTLPAGTAYAVWTGLGAAGTAILGIALLGEPFTAARAACIALIVAGVVGLKVAGG